MKKRTNVHHLVSGLVLLDLVLELEVGLNLRSRRALVLVRPFSRSRFCHDVVGRSRLDLKSWLGDDIVAVVQEEGLAVLVGELRHRA